MWKTNNFNGKKIWYSEEEYKRLQQENEELKKYQYTQKYLQSEIEKRQQALEEIREDLEQDTTCESRECGCDDYGECLKCVKETILDKINEVLNEQE